MGVGDILLYIIGGSQNNRGILLSLGNHKSGSKFLKLNT